MTTKVPPTQDAEAASDELVKNYRPLALKAVLAVLSIQGKTVEPKPRELPEYGQLPEGFHVPLELD
jgi:hypothetical protein